MTVSQLIWFGLFLFLSSCETRRERWQEQGQGHIHKIQAPGQGNFQVSHLVRYSQMALGCPQSGGQAGTQEIEVTHPGRGHTGHWWHLNSFLYAPSSRRKSSMAFSSSLYTKGFATVQFHSFNQHFTSRQLPWPKPGYTQEATYSLKTAIPG
jgi:hypothetical protein